MKEYQKQILILCNLCSEVAKTDLILKYKKMSVAHLVRQASDLHSCKTLDVYNSTSSMLQHCRLWSEKAINKYNEVFNTLQEEREGKPPTHRQCTQWRDSKGKRPFLVEHEYPLQIIRTHIIDDKYTASDIYQWVEEYGHATIILHEEDPEMITCTKEEQAKHRYDAISVVTHPQYI